MKYAMNFFVPLVKLRIPRCQGYSFYKFISYISFFFFSGLRPSENSAIPATLEAIISTIAKLSSTVHGIFYKYLGFYEADSMKDFMVRK